VLFGNAWERGNETAGGKRLTIRDRMIWTLGELHQSVVELLAIGK
jgi:hypothetical protein